MWVVWFGMLGVLKGEVGLWLVIEGFDLVLWGIDKFVFE